MTRRPSRQPGAIRTRLVLGTLIGCLVLSVPALRSTWESSREEILQRAEYDWSTLAESVAFGVGAALERGTYQDMNTPLQWAFERPEMLCVAVLGPDGTTLVARSPTGVSPAFFLTRDARWSEDRSRCDLVREIRRGDHLFGYVSLGMDAASVVKDLNESQQRSATGVGIACVILVAIAWGLGGAWDRERHAIHEARRLAENANERLEHHVLERTSELEEAKEQAETANRS